MVDTLLVERILSDILMCVQDLREVQNISWEEYSHDKRIRRFVERTLHIAVEAMIDVAQHVIADEKWREPANYRDAFAVLAEEGAVGKAHLEQYQKMAAFRNLIVHYYEKIDDEVVFGIFQRNLEDFELFVKDISQFLSVQSP